MTSERRLALVSRVVKILALLALMCLFEPSSRAQWEAVYRVGEDFAKHLNGRHAGIIGVSDPWWSNGSGLELGHYVAVSLEAALRDYGKDSDKLKVLKHQDIHETEMQLHLPLAAMGSAETRKKISDAGFADVLVFGTLESDETTFKLVLSAENIADGRILVTRSLTFPKTSFTYCLTDTFPPKADHPARTMKTDQHDPHLKIPTCKRCPIPSYNDLARRKKLQGTTVFSVLINKEGRAAAFQLVRMLGYGLDERALENVKTWAFHPAMADGQAIDSIVPIEVTFRLY
jgi:TonB family protein